MELSVRFTWGLGALIGALICFFLSRRYGKSYVEKKFNPKAITRINEFIDRHGFAAIFAARLIPLFSFDLVSYAAGVTKIRVRKFFLATLLGMIPGTIFYVELGGVLSRHQLIHILATLAALGALAYCVKKCY